MISLFKSLRAMLFFTILLGLIYPFLIMGVGYTFAKNQATGSQVSYNSSIVGSDLIGQTMSDNLFQGRPSASSNEPMASGGSNFAVNNKTQLETVKHRLAKLQTKYGSQKMVPEELLFASASGVDPDISVDGAMYQANYIAEKNGLTNKQVVELINKNTQKHFFGLATVNVLNLNIDLLKLIDKNQTSISSVF